MRFLKLMLPLIAIIIEVLVKATTTEKWFEQYLDHFNVWENRTFNQRYFEKDTYYREGGPLLLVIGAETEADPDSLEWNPSHMVAKRLNGKIVLLEHRFYGKSSPFKSPTSSELQYLSVEQALEDLAYFVESYKMQTPGMKNSKVAVFGCSYGGSLATWFRYKFPHLVDAAWASSGPLRVTLDFYEYYEIAGEMYSNVSTECIAIIRQGYREAKKLMSTPQGLKKVRSIFDGWECGNVTEMNASDILATIRNVVSDQYSGPNDTIDNCKFLQSKNSTTSCFQQLAAFVKSNAKDVCVDEDPNNDFAWEYQTCTAFGYVSTTSSNDQPFKDSHSAIDDQIYQCAENFGEGFDINILQRGINRMNRVYGSTNLKATKVLTVHGTKDPWHKLGLINQFNEEAPVLIIPGASHCADDNEKEYIRELPELAKFKKIGIEIIVNWLK